MSIDPTQMGQHLCVLQDLHALTQQELAEFARVSKSLVSKAETGEKRGIRDLAFAVAKALRVDASALMGDDAPAGGR
jgi:transcriptional regulator with XRE-family HTH domain